MAQIKRIYDLPVIKPHGTKFFVIKDGSYAQTTIDDIIEKVQTFDPANINKSFEKVDEIVKNLTTKLEAAEKKLADTEKKIADLQAAWESAVVEKASEEVIIEAAAEPAVETEETAKAKSAKKSKKAAE